MDAILAIFRIAIIATIVVTGIFRSVFEGMCSLGLVEVLDRPNSCFSYIFVKNISRSSDTCFRKIFRGPRTMLRLRRAAYKLEFYGHRDSNLVRFSRGCIY